MHKFFQLPFADHAAPSGKASTMAASPPRGRGYPARVKYHAIQAFISGTKRNGSKKTGFMITGKPNSIGSLILNSDGSRPILATLSAAASGCASPSAPAARVEPIPPIERVKIPEPPADKYAAALANPPPAPADFQTDRSSRRGS